MSIQFLTVAPASNTVPETLLLCKKYLLNEIMNRWILTFYIALMDKNGVCVRTKCNRTNKVPGMYLIYNRNSNTTYLSCSLINRSLGHLDITGHKDF